MKNIWLRVGFSVKVTDEEYEELKRSATNKYGYIDDLNAPSWLVSRATGQTGEVDGDSYIPASEFEED